MNLFIVIYLAGKIGGSIGPLPYGEDECQSRVIDLYQQCTESVDSAYRCSDVEFRCEWHDERPQSDPAAGGAE